MSEKVFITGNEAALLGAIDAGAEIMYGYPITPTTEILHGWIAKAEKENKLSYLQTEDEIAAGFGVIGSILGGQKAFTASAGPGHILLQDPISMAENMRLPFVGIIMQRGGPSTGTVNFSQQEVNLAAFGGNGDGMRIVYSASTVSEMYDLTVEAFSSAWKFRFPTFVLGDGYLGKMKANIRLNKHLNPVASEKILKEEKTPTYLRNCYSSEEELAEKLNNNISDWNKARPKLVRSEQYLTDDAKIVVIAHGIVASAAKEAVQVLRKNRLKVGLFRPITLHPFDNTGLKRALKSVRKAIIVESSLSQLARIVIYEMMNEKTNIFQISQPALGFTADEIIKAVRRYND